MTQVIVITTYQKNLKLTYLAMRAEEEDNKTTWELAPRIEKRSVEKLFPGSETLFLELLPKTETPFFKIVRETGKTS